MDNVNNYGATQVHLYTVQYPYMTISLGNFCSECSTVPNAPLPDTEVVVLTFNLMSVFIGKAVALQCIRCNNSALVPLPQVGVAVHHYLLIGGGAREGSVSWYGG